MPSDAAMNIVNTVFAGGSKSDVIDQIGDQLSSIAAEKIEAVKQDVAAKFTQIHRPFKDIEEPLEVIDIDPATGEPYKQELETNEEE